MASSNSKSLQIGFAVVTLFTVTLPAFLTGSVLPGVFSLFVYPIVLYSISFQEQEKPAVNVITGLLWLFTGFTFWYPAWQKLVYGVAVQSPGILQWLIIGSVATALYYGAYHKLENSNYKGHILAGISLVYFLTWGVFSVVGIVIVGIFGLLDRVSKYDIDPWRTMLFVIVATTLLGVFVVGGMVDGMYTKEYYADNTLSNAEKVSDMPESDVGNHRVVPMDVGTTWAEDGLQYSRYTVSGGDITYIDGVPYWSYSLSPDGTVNVFTKKQIGAVYVNQTTLNRDIMVHDEAKFKYGQGVQLTDNLHWKLAENDYLKKYKDPFVVPHKGKSYIAVPYMKHEWKFRLTPIPHIYTVPKFGGVKLVNENGKITDLKPKEASQNKILSGQNYYPYSLMKLRVKSVAYRNGIMNTLIGHKQQIEISNVPSGTNSQPFTLPTENQGVNYFIATEPWGNANAVRQIWWADSQTGRMKYVQFSKETTYKSPRKAVDAVMSEPGVSKLNDVKASEVIPVFRDGELYWQVQLVPENNAKVTYVAFYNAANEETTLIQTGEKGERKIKTFLLGKEPVKEKPNQTDGTTIQGKIRIKIVTSDGQNKTFTVDEGATIHLESINETKSTTNKTGN